MILVRTPPSSFGQVRPPVFVAGEPVIFNHDDRRELDWKARIEAAVDAPYNCPRIEFTVAGWLRRGNAFDLDNLAHPVLDVLGGAYESIWVSVALGRHPGVLLTESTPPPLPPLELEVRIETPPTSSKSGLPALAELANRVAIGSEEPLGLALAFDAADARIGQFDFNGPIKALVDAMKPIVGEGKHGPRDDRIHELRITRGQRAGEKGVSVAVWLM